MKNQRPECQPFTRRHKRRVGWYAENEVATKVCPDVKRRKPVLEAEEKEPEKHILKMPVPVPEW